jgi:serine/threonine protein phosphatase PrpC
MGDFKYKGMYEEEGKHAVTCIPTIASIPIDPETHCCLLLFSDGISDGVENSKIAVLAAGPSSEAGKKTSMESTLLTSYEKSRDNQVLLRFDF